MASDLMNYKPGQSEMTADDLLNDALTAAQPKAILRAMFARHHRDIAKVTRASAKDSLSPYYKSKAQSKAQRHEYRARKLEAQIAEYANDCLSR